MRNFDELSDRGQSRRLRGCSGEVLESYGLSDSQMTLLAHHRQTTFRVQSRTTGEKYVLRYHRSDYRTPAAIRSEFSWLRFLRDRTDVIVPEPVPTLDAQDVRLVSGEGLPKDLHSSLLKWVEGKRYFRKAGPGMRVMRQVGCIMAIMHSHAEAFTLPKDFHCPTWNWEQLFSELPEKTLQTDRQMLENEGLRLFSEVKRRVKAAMELLGTGGKVFGIIHGDLIQSNFLIHRGKVKVIDFADFGYGHFLYDMGITLFGLWGLDENQEQRRAFVAGYREVRTFSAEHEELLDLFIAARAVVQAQFVMRSQHSADRKMAPQYLRKVIDGLKRWLN